MSPKWLLGVVLALGAVAVVGHAADPFAQNRRLGRGVNIIGYDPLWRDPAQARFQAKHFKALHDAGFTSVRINLAPFRAMKAENGWQVSESWWKTMDWAVRESLANDLMPILDLHEFNVMGADPEGHKEQFLAFWRQLAAHCQGAPDAVLFEILNEPSKKLTAALWNQYLTEALAIIRQTNPTRTVIVGPTHWNAIDYLPQLELPESDHNLIVTVHYYLPMSFTHQGAPWSEENKLKHDIPWKGTPAEREAIARDFAKASAWAQAHHRPIFLGEFGAYDKAPMDSRVRYTDAVAREAERHGWSWAYWQFDSDFLLWDMAKDGWVEPIRDALVPSAPRATAPGKTGS